MSNPGPTHHASAADVIPGLEGVVAATTRLSRIDGERGELLLAGYPVGDVAPRVTFEAATHLLWHDRLPSESEEHAFRLELQREAPLGPQLLLAIREAARRGCAAIDVLRLGVSLVALDQPSPARILATMPNVLAAHASAHGGDAPLPRDASLGLAGNYLFALRGEHPTPAQTRALETYLNTVIDHGLNASAFAARVIASTGSCVGSAVGGALGALKGPLHGGAPGPALEAFLELLQRGGSLDANTRQWVRESVAAGRRIMGFGHRVYRVRDPRADVLAAAASELLADTSLAAEAAVHERAVLETLAELKPERKIATNVEFYTALLLHGLRLPVDLFTPTFAIARTAGWIAHVQEQREAGRLIRPRAAYVGAMGRSVLGPGQQA